MMEREHVLTHTEEKRLDSYISTIRDYANDDIITLNESTRGSDTEPFDLDCEYSIEIEAKFYKLICDNKLVIPGRITKYPQSSFGGIWIASFRVLKTTEVRVEVEYWQDNKTGLATISLGSSDSEHGFSTCLTPGSKWETAFRNVIDLLAELKVVLHDAGLLKEIQALRTERGY